MSGQDKDSEAESRRILDRVALESDPKWRMSRLPGLSRLSQRTRDHIAAEDADKDDWAEYWGTRIGRGLGIVIVVCLLVWFLFLMRG